ncbi:MAG: STAS domain-containing protein [Polaromonas sp.]|nr:STAS domain-containing protein [Polaromonas sp.]
MAKTEHQSVLSTLFNSEEAVSGGWLKSLGVAPGSDTHASTSREVKELLAAVSAAAKGGAPASFEDEAWGEVKQVLESLSRSRAAQGHNAGETSAFVLKMKAPLFESLPKLVGSDQGKLIEAVGQVTELVDKMAQWTGTTYQRAREEIINRQQQELLELSTPVIKLWDGVLAVPMIGTLDSSRTQLVMESLLQRIVETESTLAIIDITGVPTVDTLVAQHLLKTVTAIRLMGADCIISGIRPQIAQTIVHLGIDLQGVTSKATLADALALALKRTGYVITRPDHKA